MVVNVAGTKKDAAVSWHSSSWCSPHPPPPPPPSSLLLNIYLHWQNKLVVSMYTNFHLVSLLMFHWCYKKISHPNKQNDENSTFIFQHESTTCSIMLVAHRQTINPISELKMTSMLLIHCHFIQLLYTCDALTFFFPSLNKHWMSLPFFSLLQGRGRHS